MAPSRSQAPTPSVTTVNPAVTAAQAQRRQQMQQTINRTTQSLQAMQAAQAAARALAASGPNNLGVNPNNPSQQLPDVPNGLQPGGLVPYAGGIWTGASGPVQSTSGGKTLVNIQQNAAQALLTWQKFNIGKETTLNFDQSAGGASASQWVAFNKVNDPSGVPSQILGSIKAQGQVYVINQNGIIFGGTSQVNTHALVASSLPINDNLVKAGLLNNSDRQFLFTQDMIPKLANGSMDAFIPPVSPLGSQVGDVIVQPGAQLSSPSTAAKVGGRIALIGANVSNQGTISTPDGQTILAAGRQVGMVAHASSDPSLRGLDVYVGAVDPTGGTATNSGLIEAPRGNVIVAGKSVNQAGVINSSTSVSLNGRVDLTANYGAILNPVFDAVNNPNATPYVYQSSGTITLSPGSLTQIVPELKSSETVVGTQLALQSEINLTAKMIHMEENSLMFAPSAKVALKAGQWLPNNGSYFFTYTDGQVRMDSNAQISVAGSLDVSVPISKNILTLQLTGTELADSPLQRDGPFRGNEIQIDIRENGIYNGNVWVGTSLADVSGYVGLIQRSVGELTTSGGTVSINSGGAVIMQAGSQVDVSGGWINYEGGVVQTTKVNYHGHIVDISDAFPDRSFGGFDNESFTAHSKWGVAELWGSSLQRKNTYQKDYFEGGNGGTFSISAPTVTLDGTLLANTFPGEKQKQLSSKIQQTFANSNVLPTMQSILARPEAGALALAFQKQGIDKDFNYFSPSPPNIVFTSGGPLNPSDPLELDLSPELLTKSGFGKVTIDNSDGKITLPFGNALEFSPGGLLKLSAANLQIDGSILAPGGELSFTAYGATPYQAHLNPDPVVPVPAQLESGRGNFVLGSGASLQTSGLVVDERGFSSISRTQTLATAGGKISISSYNVKLESGSVIDVSGGVDINYAGKRDYGAGGQIEIKAGQDPKATYLTGGKLLLGSELRGFSGIQGGSLSVQNNLVQIGGAAPPSVDPGLVLFLRPDFFSQGGFESFTIGGLGIAVGPVDEYLPAVNIAPGTVIAPRLQNLLAVDAAGGGIALRKTNLPDAQRASISLNFQAKGVNAFPSGLALRGDFIMGKGSVIVTGPFADSSKGVSITAQTAAINGSIYAPGGGIRISGGADSGKLFTTNPDKALVTLQIGKNTVLSTAGVANIYTDARGYRTGTVASGGVVSLSGNILAEKGSIIDVSGTSGTLDLLPWLAGSEQKAASGILLGSRRVEKTVSSDAGSIVLQGSQMLFSDASLRGWAHAGAEGGSLQVSSDIFRDPSDTQQKILPNLNIQQQGNVIPASFVTSGISAIGRPVINLSYLDSSGGFIAVSSFAQGGFDGVDLKGIVKFNGNVSVSAGRELRVADGGVIFANGNVRLSASAVRIGMPFQAPLSLAQQQQFQSVFTMNGPFFFGPTFGSGRLTVQADLIDIGNLSLQNIGRADFLADNGDIRGNGTLDVAGDIVLRAGQIYPPTAVSFTIAAYDHAGIKGSVTIQGSGRRSLPLSAGGTLNIYGSIINQGGTLRAPGGTINLGWDGTGSSPKDYISGAGLPGSGTLKLSAVATTGTLNLLKGSTTSVSFVDPVTGEALMVPYGLDLYGSQWIDPSGTDISAGGVAAKKVNLSGVSVQFQSGAKIDISGGGDLFSYRWIPGVGGSRDVLSSTSSFAILPGYGAGYAPYAPFANSSNFSYNDPASGTSITDPGYVNDTLRVGDSIYLNASSGLAAGSYVLLPARYALLPGAFLVTPKGTVSASAVRTAEGSYLVSGYRFNGMGAGLPTGKAYSGFEISPSSVVSDRSEYSVYAANTSLRDSALANNAAVPRLPMDAGQIVFKAIQGMSLRGKVVSSTSGGGRGSVIDIKSPVDILINATGEDSSFAGLVLGAGQLSAFGAESLLVGGERTFGKDGTSIAVSTNNLKVDNAGTPLSGIDIILAANKNLTLASGAEIEQTSRQSGDSDNLLLGNTSQAGSGNGVLVRVSNDPNAQILRSGVNVLDTTPALTVGSGVKISGLGVTLDSTAQTLLSQQAQISGDYLSFSSGRIFLQLDDNVSVPSANNLLLTGSLLGKFRNARSLSLLSYSTLDVYGAGEFSINGNLAIHAAAIRGFANGGGIATVRAANISVDNQMGTTAPASLGTNQGTLNLDATTVTVGTGRLGVEGFSSTQLQASEKIFAASSGNLVVSGDLLATTPYITAAKGVSYGFESSGAMTFDSLPGNSAQKAGGLGAKLTFQGSKVRMNSDILLRSGTVDIQAVGSNAADGVEVGGTINVGGTSQSFYDVVKYTNGGKIKLGSKAGDVKVLSNGSLIVSAAAGGGDAGAVTVQVPKGVFQLDGSMLGKAGSGGGAGSFSLEAGVLGSTAGIASNLNTGGFFKSNAFRILSGDVVIDSNLKAQRFVMSADRGSIVVGANGRIDASGSTGGNITLVASGSVVLMDGSVLTAEADDFNSAGKGGAISLEAGSAINGVAAATGTARNSGTGLFGSGVSVVDIRSGATINLGVKSTYDSSGVPDQGKLAAAASLGHFTGTLHLRAPQTTAGTDLQVNKVEGTILGSPSNILVEGFRVYQTSSIDSVESQIFNNGTTFGNATASMPAIIFGAGNPLINGVAPAVVITSGAEVINLNGDLTLANDWDLSTYRFGPRNAAGVLTLRAKGNLVFNGALSDGFDPNLQRDGLPLLYLAPLMANNASLPVNAQSWSYRMAAGADLSAADFHKVKDLSSLTATSGSLKLGQAFATLPPSLDNITLLAFFDQNFFPQFIRTGSGDIDIATGRDIVLLNPFATIYTAGTQIFNPTRVLASSGSDFDLPNPLDAGQPALGAVQFPLWAPQYSMAGGNVTLNAQGDIKHRTSANKADSSREIPTNWLYRRSYVAGNGNFGTADSGDIASTTWWVDFSNFFEGVGALGGGNVTLNAGGNVENVDAVVATNARMAGKNTTTGQALAPDASNLVELGGGDLTVRASGDIDGGIYYVERGQGILEAGKSIHTNSTRAPSVAVATGATVTAPETTWLPTTLFLGKGGFDVFANGDITLGPTVNAFLAPPGLSNTPAYRTYFSTYAPDSSVEVASLGGNILLREEAVRGAVTNPILEVWLGQVSIPSNVTNVSSYEPWIRLAETNILPFSTALSLHPGTLSVTAFSGNIDLAGDLTLSPAPRGSLNLLAAGAINGLSPVGSNIFYPTLWDSSQIIVSDANPQNVPGITSPLATQAIPVSPGSGAEETRNSVLFSLDALFTESGSTLGNQGSVRTQTALHDSNLLHQGDSDPVRLYAGAGSIVDLTLFSPKETRVLASEDITDIGFYIQNVSAEDLSVISAGRDIIAYNPNSSALQKASASGNLTVDGFRDLHPEQSGDIQIAGPGNLEVIAGRNLTLGVGRNSDLPADVGLGITSVGNARNPALTAAGAGIFAAAGIGGVSDLSGSNLDLDGFISKWVTGQKGSRYLSELEPSLSVQDFNQLPADQQALKAVEIFYLVLRDAGRDHNDPNSLGYGNYDAAEMAIKDLFGQNPQRGEMNLSSRSIKTGYGGDIQILAPAGGVTLGYEIPAAGQVPPGIVTENGGDISIFSDQDVQVGSLRIFTLRGGDEMIYSARGDIAAGSASRTVKTAPPTRVLIDPQSADVKNDLAGLATGGGIGVLASVAGVEPGNVDLIAPVGAVDAGEAGIRSSGNLNIAAQVVLNAGNIQVAGSNVGGNVAAPAAPNVAGLTSASNASGAATNSSAEMAKQSLAQNQIPVDSPSIITVEVLGYGGDE